VPYPTALLEDIKQVLSSESILYLEVPFERLMQDKNAKLPMAKKHWHEHINFFSEESLRRLVSSVDLKILSLQVIEAKAGGTDCSLFQIACQRG
jgi:hypothetical protein